MENHRGSLKQPSPSVNGSDSPSHKAFDSGGGCHDTRACRPHLRTQPAGQLLAGAVCGPPLACWAGGSRIFRLNSQTGVARWTWLVSECAALCVARGHPAPAPLLERDTLLGVRDLVTAHGSDQLSAGVLLSTANPLPQWIDGSNSGPWPHPFHRFAQCVIQATSVNKRSATPSCFKKGCRFPITAPEQMADHTPQRHRPRRTNAV